MSAADDASHWQGEGDPTSGLATLSGEIDFSNSSDVRTWLRQFYAAASGGVTLDLSKVDYIDSSGLAVLIEARKSLKAENRSIRISAASEQVRKLFSLTQIGDLFGI